MTSAPALHPSQDQAIRSTGIGGSDVPIILGLSPYASPFDLWARKVGMAPPQPSNRGMTWGTILEDVVARHYAKVTPRVLRIRKVNQTIRMPGKPWLLAHPDRLVYLEPAEGASARERRILEVKTGSAFDSSWERTPDGLPAHVLLQVMHYLAVTGLTRADVAALLGGSDYRRYEVEWDPELWAKVEPHLDAFWRRVVEKDAPPLDGSESTQELLKALYPRDAGRVITADQVPAEVAAAANLLKLARYNVDAAERAKAEQEAVIKAYMEDAAELQLPDGSKVTWRTNRDSEVIGWEQYAHHLEGLLPDAYRDQTETIRGLYTNTRPGARVFRPTFKEDTTDA